MKIAHLVAPARFGGLERVVRGLARGQKKADYEVTLIALLESGVAEPSLVSELRDAGVHLTTVVYPARSFRAQRQAVLDICRRLQPDVLHSHGYLPDVISASLGRSFQSVRVSTVHGFTGGSLRNRFYEWMQRRSYARFDVIVAVSKKLATELGAEPSSRERIHTVRNAWSPASSPFTRVDARQRLNLPPDVFIVGWVGRMSREKGPDVFLEALSHLVGLRLQFVFIGEGRERPLMETRAKALGVQSRISWVGEIPDASRFFPAFDVFVNSSRTEGTPITLFEAMSAGVPVIATAVGGVPDVVSADEALLIPSEDPEALAAAIRDVHDARAKAVARAERAGARLERDFDVRPWIEAYERVYRGALARRSRT